MYPFFHILGVTFPAYGTLIAIGVLVAGTIFYFRTPKRERGRALFAVGIAAFCAIVGAKINFVLVTPLIWQGFTQFLLYGFVFYGGLIGGVLGGMLATRIAHLPFLPLMDTAAPCIALGHGIGRMGCYLAGCCFGRPDFPLPVQLVESGLLYILAGALLLYAKGEREHGETTGLYLFSYAVIRFVTERLRADVARGSFEGLSTGQWTSVFVLIAGIVLLARILRLTLRVHGGEKGIVIQVMLYALGGAVRVQMTLSLARDANGKPSLHLSVGKRPLQLPQQQDVQKEQSIASAKALLPALHIRKFHVTARVGIAQEAALTAQLCGTLGALLYGVGTYIHSREKGCTDISLSVNPNFEKDELDTQILCIVYATTGNLTFRTSQLLIKQLRGKMQVWHTRLKTSCVPPWKT